MGGDWIPDSFVEAPLLIWQRLSRVIKTDDWYPHGESAKAGAIDDNKWTGHLVAIAENIVIDMTIGQLNSERLSINFSPSWSMFESDIEFEAGRRPIMGIQEGMFIRTKPSRQSGVLSRQNRGAANRVGKHFARN